MVDEYLAAMANIQDIKGSMMQVGLEPIPPSVFPGIHFRMLFG